MADACGQYCDRLRSHGLELVTAWHKTDAQLTDAVLSHHVPTVCLDEHGRTFDSPGFSKFLYRKLDDGRSRACFVVGGAEGLPQALRPGSTAKELGSRKLEYVSLSQLTFTHQMARLILTEQVYRASEIQRGSSYHKE